MVSHTVKGGGQPLPPRLGLERCPGTHMFPKMSWVLSAVRIHTGFGWRDDGDQLHTSNTDLVLTDYFIWNKTV